MTVITVTTVGYRKCTPCTDWRALTVVLLLGGVGTFFYVLSLFVAGVRRASPHGGNRSTPSLLDSSATTSSSAATAAWPDHRRRFRRRDLCRSWSSTATPSWCRLIAGQPRRVGRRAGLDVLRRIGIQRPRPDFGGRLGRERPSKRAADACRPVHHRPGRERGRHQAAAAGPTACSRPTRPGAPDGAGGAAAGRRRFRPARDQLRATRAGHRADPADGGLTPVRPVARRGQRPAALPGWWSSGSSGPAAR